MDYAAGTPARTKPKSKLEQRASLLSTGHVKNSKRRRNRGPNSTKQVSLHPFKRFKLPHHPSCRCCISQCLYMSLPYLFQLHADTQRQNNSTLLRRMLLLARRRTSTSYPSQRSPSDGTREPECITRTKSTKRLEKTIRRTDASLARQLHIELRVC